MVVAGEATVIEPGEGAVVASVAANVTVYDQPEPVVPVVESVAGTSTTGLLQAKHKRDKEATRATMAVRPNVQLLFMTTFYKLVCFLRSCVDVMAVYVQETKPVNKRYQCFQ
jgi:hypothetical protein